MFHFPVDTPQTHLKTNSNLLGKPIEIVTEDHSVVELKTCEEMVVDEKGLIHGGFIFGLADYAAMLAVNHPYVVLKKAEVKFIRPVKVGSTLLAEAKVVARTLNTKGREERLVEAIVKRKEDGVRVFEGKFTCVILPKHVLDLVKEK